MKLQSVPPRLAVCLAALLVAASVPAQQPAGPGVVSSPLRPTSGTHVTYSVIDAIELQPITSAYTYGCAGSPCTLRFATNSTSGYPLQATLHLPAGALVTYMELDYWDASPTGRVWATLSECDYVGLNCASVAGSPACADINTTLCSQVGEMGGEGGVALTLDPPMTIDNVAHRYVILAGNSTNGGDTGIGRVMLGYVLQVSPPTPVALFNDVPTTHPFFQFIGALAASGITAGCGNGNYCPDSPLTRGQMAVFLAKALGLQWE